MGQPARALTASELALPTRIPMNPPTRHKTTASTRNWFKISLVSAPTAIRNPISRVRSVTETSMMFMMPTPPTTRETAATDMPRAESMPTTRLKTLETSALS